MIVAYYQLVDNEKKEPCIERSLLEIEISQIIFEGLVDGEAGVYSLKHNNLVIIRDRKGEIKGKDIRAIAVSSWDEFPEPIHGDFFICRLEDNELVNIQFNDIALLDEIVRPALEVI